MRFLARLIATFAFVGMIPLAPGTWASAITLALWVWVVGCGVPFWIALVTAGVAGTWAAHRAEAIYGHDSHHVVIDEVFGALVAVAFFPPHAVIAIAAFVLFRFFDIVKPPPIYQIQSYPGGFGVMADDLLAGVAANLMLRLVGLAVPALVR